MGPITTAALAREWAREEWPQLALVAVALLGAWLVWGS